MVQDVQDILEHSRPCQASYRNRPRQRSATLHPSLTTSLSFSTLSSTSPPCETLEKGKQLIIYVFSCTNNTLYLYYRSPIVLIGKLPALPHIWLDIRPQGCSKVAVCLLPFQRDVSRCFYLCKTMGVPILYPHIPPFTSHQDLLSNLADRNESETRTTNRTSKRWQAEMLAKWVD